MTDVLVSAKWANDNLNSGKFRLVEVSVETSNYDKEHIPGAVNFSWVTQLQDQVQRDIISQENFEKLLGSHGIGRNTHVILYGDNNNWFAAYAFWVFKYYGHEAVSLLDGGIKKWKLENYPLTDNIPTNTATNYVVDKINAEYRADRDYIKQRLETPGVKLVDVRSPAEYKGEIIAPPGMSETAQRPGHIPGAANIPWATAVAEDGTYKSVEELRQIYGGKGITSDANEVIAYCRIGERSSHTWFALKYLLGHKNVRNYDGSWTEWGNLIGNPIRLGEQP